MDTSDYISIPLTRGYSTVIDQIDSYLLEYKWSTGVGVNTYYAKRGTTINYIQKTIQMHCVIMSKIIGRELMQKEWVDHIDGNGLNNRRENLRLASPSQNARNRSIQKNSTTGYKGVSPKGKSYQARITIDGNTICLGTFPTPELAALAYAEAALKHHKEFARF